MDMDTYRNKWWIMYHCQPDAAGCVLRMLPIGQGLGIFQSPNNRATGSPTALP